MRATTCLLGTTLLWTLGWGGEPAAPIDEVTLAATPVPASLVAAGAGHACFVKNGAVSCAGDHSLGQVGIGFFLQGGLPAGCLEPYPGYPECEVPKPVLGLQGGVTQIAAGTSFSCALLGTGEVRCWGSNLYGQLGIGAGAPAGCYDTHDPILGVYCASPVKVTGVSTAVEITAGEFGACARLASGQVQCWGLNLAGQLGIGTSKPAQCVGSTVQGFAYYCHSPVTVPGLSGVIDVESVGGGAGTGHTCAVLSSGAVRCWGLNGQGELGIGATLPAGCLDLSSPRDGIADVCPSPQPVQGLAGLQVKQVAASGTSTCVLVAKAGGGTEARCFGGNFVGQLGIGTARPAGCDETNPNNNIVEQCRLPVLLTTLSNPKRLSGGWLRMCAVGSAGQALCWGSDDRRGLGLGDGPLPAVCTGTGAGGYCHSPITVQGLPGPVTSVITAETGSCAALTAGGVECWGQNSYGLMAFGHTVPAGCSDYDHDGRADTCPIATPSL